MKATLVRKTGMLVGLIVLVTMAIVACRGDDEKAGLVTCPPGWECEKVNEKQILGYGLADDIELVNPGSYEGLNSEILGAFEKEEDILFYYWAPETLPTKLDTTYGGYYRLEEPAYTKECWDHMSAAAEAEDVEQACAYPDAEVVIVVRSELIAEAPDAVEFLKNWTLSTAQLDTMLARLDETGDDYADVAAWWLQQDDTWKNWVADGIADKVTAGLGGAAMTPDSTKPTLIFSDLNWSTALLQNAVARAILQDGYDYPTDSVAGGTIPLMQALVAGDTNVTLEIWLPNQQEAYAKATAEGTIERIGKSIDGSAWQSAFLIPQYTKDANPGLNTVEDLKKDEYKSLFVRADTQ